MLRMSKLGDEQRGGTVGNGNTETDEETTSNKHLNIHGDGLEDDTENHDNTTNENTCAAPKNIGGIRNEWNSADRSDGHHGAHKTQSRAIGRAEVRLPVIEGLKTVKHRPVVTVGGLFQSLSDFATY